MDASELRASDADRETTIARLSAHAAEGRLEAGELEERVEAALAARSAGELTILEEDLPPAGGRRRVRSLTAGPDLRAYLLVMTLLIAIWALTGAGYFWPVWPALGWGIGLLSPGGCRARAFGRGRRLRAG